MDRAGGLSFDGACRPPKAASAAVLLHDRHSRRRPRWRRTRVDAAPGGAGAGVRCQPPRQRAWPPQPAPPSLVPPGILSAKADIFAPCALGGVIDEVAAGKFRAKVVCGCAAPTADGRENPRHGARQFGRTRPLGRQDHWARLREPRGQSQNSDMFRVQGSRRTTTTFRILAPDFTIPVRRVPRDHVFVWSAGTSLGKLAAPVFGACQPSRRNRSWTRTHQIAAHQRIKGFVAGNRQSKILWNKMVGRGNAVA